LPDLIDFNCPIKIELKVIERVILGLDPRKTRKKVLVKNQEIGPSFWGASAETFWVYCHPKYFFLKLSSD
jgi:hypothetical protein